MIGILICGIILLCAAVITIPSIIFIPPLTVSRHWFDSWHKVTLGLGGIATFCFLFFGVASLLIYILSLSDSSETESSDSSSEDSKEQ